MSKRIWSLTLLAALVSPSVASAASSDEAGQVGK